MNDEKGCSPSDLIGRLNGIINRLKENVLVQNWLANDDHDISEQLAGKTFDNFGLPYCGLEDTVLLEWKD